MLEKIVLTKKLGKKNYKQVMPELSDRLFRSQKIAWSSGTAVVILFEGWDAAGKGTTIQKLTSSLDPRGFRVYPIRAPRTYERKWPWMRRFWMKLPGRGEWAIFNRSWYRRITNDRIEGIIPENEWRHGYRDIVDFERMLVDDGYLLVKFFLHISRQEQKRRFDQLSSDPMTAWRITAQDWDRYRHYDDWEMAWEEVFDRTDTEWAPWTIVEAHNSRFAWVKIYRTILDLLDERLGIPQIIHAEQRSIDAPQLIEQEALQKRNLNDTDLLKKVALAKPESTAIEDEIETVNEEYFEPLGDAERDD